MYKVTKVLKKCTGCDQEANLRKWRDKEGHTEQYKTFLNFVSLL